MKKVLCYTNSPKGVKNGFLGLFRRKNLCVICKDFMGELNRELDLLKENKRIKNLQIYIGGKSKEAIYMIKELNSCIELLFDSSLQPEADKFGETYFQMGQGKLPSIYVYVDYTEE